MSIYRIQRLRIIRRRVEEKAKLVAWDNAWARTYARDVAWLLKDIKALEEKMKDIILDGIDKQNV